MGDILSLISHHGYALIAVAVFLEAIGVPVPAALALLAAGTASALGKLRLGLVLASALPAMVIGDTLLFTLGRHTGWTLLGLLCRVSVNPETCILRSAESFYRRGKATLVLAKFIPGINTMAPPLAGSMNMRMFQFLRLDAAGAALYITAYVAAGFLFSRFFGIFARGLQSAGHAVEWAVLAGVLGYISYRLWLYWKHRMYRVVPRVTVAEVKRKLDEGFDIVLADVRSHGYYDAGASRIHGSIRLEPNALAAALKDLPKDKEIYLYCT
jgi:membrane protein DedA with SNARE-associated domain